MAKKLAKSLVKVVVKVFLFIVAISFVGVALSLWGQNLPPEIIGLLKLAGIAILVLVILLAMKEF